MNVLYITVGNGGSDVALLSFLKRARDKHNINPLVIVNKNSKNGLAKSLDKLYIHYIELMYDFDLVPKWTNIRNIHRYFYQYLIRLIFNPIAVLKIKSIAKSSNVDLIHSNTSCYQIGYRVAKTLNIPHVWHFREFQDLDFGVKPLFGRNNFQKKVLDNLNYCIAITSTIYYHHDLIKTKNSFIIYDGILNKDNIRFTNDKQDYFLFVGRLSEQKGIYELIYSFINFSKYNQNFILKLCGKFQISTKAELTKILNKFNLASRVQFLGERNDINDLMYHATALIVPSKFEAFGLVTVEAMANGCLVIGNNTGGTKEQFDKGFEIVDTEIGLRYSGENQLTNCLKNVVNNGIEYYYLNILASQRVIADLYTIENNVNGIINVYNLSLGKVNQRSFNYG
ncbi:glycosyltransferase [Anditalea andensis]|uniref:Glycosyl transferase family 1 domain-containing protein n=1 Tax=Anditalea andensis TaxID=1048983 RepID=A0A074LDG5_9BACT|nr:glycosyltransferase [Anditalea andensis]KEO71832.1 hypothetical protein EL17_21160 [Anditalea andensis]